MASALRLVLLAIGVSALVPAAAGAQIFAARDAKGTMVLSNQRIERPTTI